MPIYEMPVLLRVMSKPETASVLKRISNVIFDRGGFIRKIDNLGQQPLPYKMILNSVGQKESINFIFHFDMPPRNIYDMMDEYNRDLDIIRNRIYKKPDEDLPSKPCTWHEEMLPVPFRSDVKKLMEMSNKVNKAANNRSFKFNSGLDYYPFQR